MSQSMSVGNSSASNQLPLPPGPKGHFFWAMLPELRHDPRFWTESERFDSARFGPERSAIRAPFIYAPGAGLRQCIGNQSVLTEAQLVLASIAQRYQLWLAPGQPCNPIQS